MILFVDEIIVPERFRKNFGELDELAEDIRQNGLINPIVVNRDNVLLAGERRLRAVKMLGWKEVEVHVIDTKDEAHELNIELSENDVRKGFSKKERTLLMEKIQEIESAKAKERQATSTGGADPQLVENFPQAEKGRTRDKVAEAFGVSSGTMRKEMAIVKHEELLDPADFAEWDEGKLSTNKVYQKLKAELQKLKEDQESKTTREKFEIQKAERLQKENESLKEQVQELESREPEVIEKTVEVEVVPDDYETLKTDCSKLKKRAEHAERERFETNEELNEAKRKIKDYESRKDILEMQKKLEEEAGFFTIRTYDYIQKNGGNVWITQRLMQLPDDKRKEFIDSIFAIDAFAQQMVANIGGYGIERTKE